MSPGKERKGGMNQEGRRGQKESRVRKPGVRERRGWASGTHGDTQGLVRWKESSYLERVGRKVWKKETFEAW